MLQTTVTLLALSFTASSVLNLAYQRFCFPWFTGTSPCVRIQETQLALNKAQHGAWLVAIAAIVDYLKATRGSPVRPLSIDTDTDEESIASCDSFYSPLKEE